MALKRCENGHYFDPAKHTSCPSCGVQNINFDPTRKKDDVRADVPPTGPIAAPPRKEQRQAALDEGKTIAGPQAELGIDPVVGWLVCIEGPDRGRDFRIRSERNFVGRSQTMDVSIPGDQAISRENQAIVSFNPKNRQFKIHPGDARGMVYLNGEEVDGPQGLKAGDHIEMGKTKLLFVPLCGDSFTWE